MWLTTHLGRRERPLLELPLEEDAVVGDPPQLRARRGGLSLRGGDLVLELPDAHVLGRR